jgi:uncharacterized membrane protein HdeD (DUF308 family)
MAGAWVAWRRNPTYSTRSTLQAAVFVLLSVAAVIGMIVAAVNLTMNKSPIVVGITMALVIVFGALSLIFIIQAVTTPKAAKLETVLPPSAKLVHFHRQKIYKWVKFLAIFIVVCGVLWVVIPGKASYAALSLGGLALLLASVLLPVGYVTARQFDVSLTAMECSPWVHWQYTPEQWKQWTNVQVERMEATPPKIVLKRDWRSLGWTFTAIAGASFLFYPGRWLLDSLTVLFCCGLILAIVVWSPHENLRAAERMRTNLLKVTPEVYFGHDGVFCDGVYTTWLTMNVYLTSASIDERQPRSLLFRFERIDPNPYGGYPAVPIHQSVLIPAGGDNDVVRLQKELTARCPKAQIALC